MSQSKAYVKRIDTPLGILCLDTFFLPDQLKAELRGLDLLCSVVNSTPVWSFELSSKKPFIVSNDNGPEILIYVFECIRKKLCEDDPHLKVYMSQRPICVLNDQDIIDNTPSTDSIVSLVLLGIAGWPSDLTPKTLAKKAKYAGKGVLVDISKLLESDHNQIETAMHLYRENFNHEALSVLAQLARRLYVCRFWSFEKIDEVLRPIINEFDEQHIRNYLQKPDEETDKLFLGK